MLKLGPEPAATTARCLDSFVMDEPHLLVAARYVQLNPVRAGLCETVEHSPWSSARAHLSGEDDELVLVHPLLELISD